MYQIVYTRKFSKSFLRLTHGGLKRSVQEKIQYTITLIASGKKLDTSYKDHQLHGIFAEYRECHIQGDLLLMYQILDKELVLVLINIGSHNDLF